MPLRLSIILLSAAAIAHQILLMRLLSVVQWHHFAYMVISLALLGYGASGTFLALLGRHLHQRLRPFLLVNAVGFGLLAVGTFAIVQRLPFNPLEVPWDLRQLGHLALFYLLLAAPFFCAANFVGACLTHFSSEAHRLYQADLVGAGCGALAIIAVLFVLSPSACLLLIGAMGFLAATVAGLDRRIACGRGALVVILLLGAASTLAWPAAWLEPRLSQFKGLRKALLLPQVEVIAERSSPLGLLSVVRSPVVPFRFAPGLSLEHLEPLPEQLAIFTDGDSMTVVDRAAGTGPESAYLESLPSALPYHLLRAPRVLVLGAGGGTEVASALRHGARRIDAVEVNPQMSRLLAGDLAEFSGDLARRPGVTVHTAEARGFLAGDERRFDLIQISLLDASAGGMHSLSESYLYTVEAFESYLEHLAPGGSLSITRWLRLPPRDSLRLVSTAAEVLSRRGLSPARQIAVLRTWNAVTVLVKEDPISATEVERIRSFAADRAFDTAWFPGISAADANRFNQFEEPYHFAAISSLLGPESERFRRRYKFHLAPTSDNRPFFFHFSKWRTTLELLEARRRGGAAMLDWGYLVLLASLAQAAVAGLLLIVLPLAVIRRTAGRSAAVRFFGLYFFLLGLAFLFLEIAFIQQITLFLGHPLYAVAVVLAAFLIFAGLGSGYSVRLRSEAGADGDQGTAGPARRRLPPISRAVVGIAILALTYLALLPPLFDRLIGHSAPLKVAVSLLLLAPLAFLMGMPFPLGLHSLRRRHAGWIPWAWGINGWASVLSAILATLVAVHLGFRTVVLSAVLLYLGAAALVRDRR